MLAVSLLAVITARAQDDTTVMAAGDSVTSAADIVDTTDDYRLPDTVILRSVPDTNVYRMQHERVFAYANDPEYWVKKKPRVIKKDFWDRLNDFTAQRKVRPFFYLLVGGILLFAFYKVVVANNLYIFYSGARRRKAEEDMAFTEIDDDTIDQKIAQAVAVNDYRTAVRHLYLKSLRALSEKGWIHYHAQATNTDYVQQVSRYAIAPDFSFLTRVYEYVWYGEFILTAPQFAAVRQQFQQLYQSIGE